MYKVFDRVYLLDRRGEVARREEYYFLGYYTNRRGDIDYDYCNLQSAEDPTDIVNMWYAHKVIGVEEYNNSWDSSRYANGVQPVTADPQPTLRLQSTISMQEILNSYAREFSSVGAGGLQETYASNPFSRSS